ncbi:reverse transcriptase domain-containing protein [Tanacetum coccineum]
MSTHSGPSPTAPTSAVRNTIGKGREVSQGNLNGPASDAALREYCDKHYDQLLPILAEKMHQEKHSESGTPSRKRDLRERLISKRIRSMSGSPKPRRGQSESPRKRDPERKTVFKRLEKDVFYKLEDKEKSIGAEPASKKHRNKRASSRRTEALSESEDSEGGHWKSRSKSKDQALKMMIYPSHGEDPEDHLKIFQAAAKVERWAMPTWCHMFNSTLTGSARVWFDDLPPESVDSYDDLKEAFLANFRQQKNTLKIPWKSTISRREKERFMHGITNPELIKRLHDKIPRLVDEMMRITTSFLRGDVAAGNQERKKSLPPWKQQEAGHKQNFKKGGKFKAPPPITTLVEKRNSNKFCEFHREAGHNTDECMHLKKQIEELLKNGKLSRLIKELKQNSRKDQPKTNKKGETSNKDNALAIMMTPPGNKKSNGSGHRPLIGFSGEIIWPLGQISLLVKIGDEEHSTSAWMNFVIVRLSSPYNGIIGRPGVKKIQAVPSTAHRMLKFPVAGGILTLKSSKIIPIECAAVSKPEGQPSAVNQAIKERIKVHRHVLRNPQQKLTPITSSWPFYKWGIDIDGPFSKGPGKVKILIVAIDYFTKWIEAKPVATITGNQVTRAN